MNTLMGYTCVDNKWAEIGLEFWESIWLGSPAFQAPATGVGGESERAFLDGKIDTTPVG
jgi:hypothetical protein